MTVGRGAGGGRTLFRRFFYDHAEVPLERRADGVIPFVGLTLAKKPPEPKEPVAQPPRGVAAIGTTAAVRLLERLEDALARGDHGEPAKPRGRGPRGEPVETGPSNKWSIDSITGTHCTVRFRDRATPGEPEVQLTDVNGSIQTPVWGDGRLLGALVEGSLPGGAERLQVAINGRMSEERTEVAVQVTATGVDPVGLKAYMEPA